MDTKTQIEALEERFIDAMKNSNIGELNALLADGLIFTNHNGHLITKQDDLQTHSSVKLEIYSIDTSAQLIEVLDDNTAIVSVIKDLSSEYDGHVSVGIFRFTRVWHFNGTQWQIVAAHSSQLVS